MQILKNLRKSQLNSLPTKNAGGKNFRHSNAPRQSGQKDSTSQVESKFSKDPMVEICTQIQKNLEQQGNLDVLLAMVQALHEEIRRSFPEKKNSD